VATIKAKLNHLKNEKAKLSSSIKLQSKKVELCKEDLQNMLYGVGGMTKAFQLIENALTDV
jgi:Cu/Ag efflux protein CusF